MLPEVAASELIYLTHLASLNDRRVVHDLKYPGTLFGSVIPPRFDAVLNAALSTIFEPAGTAFKENMEQVRLLSQMPEFVVRSTAKQITFDVTAGLNALGIPFPVGPSEEDNKKLIAEKERLIAITPSWKPTQTEILSAMHMLDTLCSVDRGHEHARIGIEAMLIAMLLQTWTAFESFITDVWVVALNNYPDKFAKRVAGAKSSSGAQPQDKSMEKSVPITSLERYGYDLTKSMGFLLKDKFDFDRLKNVERAYVAAFGENVKTLFDTAVTDSANVAALEVIRNLFAHRAGKADLQFRIGMSRCQGSTYYHKLKDWPDDERVSVDAEMVQDLLLSVCSIAQNLLIFVKRKTNAPASAP